MLFVALNPAQVRTSEPLARLPQRRWPPRPQQSTKSPRETSHAPSKACPRPLITGGAARAESVEQFLKSPVPGPCKSRIHTVTRITFTNSRLPQDDGTMTAHRWDNTMCDLAYINLLREKVRQLEAEGKRLRDFPQSSGPRFVPYLLPAQSVPAALEPSHDDQHH
jgi:hypothetical protein